MTTKRHDLIKQSHLKCKVKFVSNSHMHDTPSKAYLIENKGPLVMVVSVSLLET
jgi:predicted ATP-grasp superfamily ATP-dependent carboligase